MAGNKAAGDRGEREVIDLVPCPNCGRRLMGLPSGYPLYDVQCTGCSFRAQVKTNQSKPKVMVFGAGWEIMEKVLKSGFLTPALIANFNWHDKTGTHREIRFYPFVPKANLKKRFTVIKKSKRNLWMFNYIGLDQLPHFILYKK
jgi:hypothetical protein